MENLINDNFDPISSDESDKEPYNELCWKLKLYFNSNKSLIVCVNHSLLGIYICQFKIHKCYGFNKTCLKHTLLNP